MYFYIEHIDNKNRIKGYKRKILALVDEDKKESHVKFIAIPDNRREVESINLLPRILGSISFVDKGRDFIESYYSLRREPHDDNPIYFRMPTCMKDAFYDYFKSLINETKEEEQHDKI